MNKLYDNRPTISSNGEEPSPKSQRKFTNAKFDGGKKDIDEENSFFLLTIKLKFGTMHLMDFCIVCS